VYSKELKICTAYMVEGLADSRLCLRCQAVISEVEHDLQEQEASEWRTAPNPQLLTPPNEVLRASVSGCPLCAIVGAETLGQGFWFHAHLPFKFIVNHNAEDECDLEVIMDCGKDQFGTMITANVSVRRLSGMPPGCLTRSMRTDCIM